VTQRDLQAEAVATAHVHECNFDEACRIGADALALAERQQVTTNVQDVRRLRLDLEPWRDAQAVRGCTNSSLPSADPVLTTGLGSTP
jgi:hypothetical protein